MTLSKSKVFLTSFLFSLISFLLYFYFTQIVKDEIKFSKLSDSVYVTEQIKESDLDAIKKYGFTALIDFRPDGEAVDQTPSSKIQLASSTRNIDFYYIPVPHGQIPDDAVNQLQAVLSKKPQSTLLYCRSGNRASRAFALVEASRKDGPDIQSILAMVKSTGHSADDLRQEIERRIANRRV